MPFAVNLRVSQPEILIPSYGKSLSESDKERYVEKLKTKSSSGTVNLDPHFIDPSKCSENLTLWLDVLYGSIYNYLIQCRCIYMPKGLKHARHLKELHTYVYIN